MLPSLPLGSCTHGGRGNYGRLGHGSNDDFSLPTLVTALQGMKVVDVACGSQDAQTLAVIDTGWCKLQHWLWAEKV